ncbi:MAG: DUF1217 domain-containing protein [Silicimonas sp.]|nr:DUF1217 domain-containing protein [Silicimonas sp.]
MTYQPVLPSGGNLGWAFLKNTRAAQQEAFDSSAIIAKNATYFDEKVGDIQTAEDLVSDRRLLTVALGAFGLDDDINNRFFIRKVLEDGTLDQDAFANRLSDRRYFEMAEAFGFDLSPPNTVLSTFPTDILEQYKVRQFEVAIGDQDEDMRLALGLERGLASLAEKSPTEDVAWFTVMGTPPMRRVFEVAFGLPPQFGLIDIDRQRAVLSEKSEQTFGVSNPTDFTDPELREKLVQSFLFRSELASSAAATARGSVALTLLQSQPPLF